MSDFKFGELHIGEKIIIISAAIAILSHILPWVDIGIATSSGFSQTIGLFLLPWVYPVYCIIEKKEMKTIYGYICGAIAVVAVIVFIANNQVDMMGKAANVSGNGTVLYFVAAAGLLFGVFKVSKKEKTSQ